MLQPTDQKSGCCLNLLGVIFEACFSGLLIFREQGCESEFRRIEGQVTERDLIDDPLWKASLNLSKVLFDPPNPYVFTILFRDLDSTAETLRIENFKQRRETVRMAVVRCSRKGTAGVRSAVLEPELHG